MRILNQNIFREEILEKIRNHMLATPDDTPDIVHTALVTEIKADTTPRTLPLAIRLQILDATMPVIFLPNADGSNPKATKLRTFPDYELRKQVAPSYLLQADDSEVPAILSDEAEQVEAVTLTIPPEDSVPAPTRRTRATRSKAV